MLRLTGTVQGFRLFLNPEGIIREAVSYTGTKIINLDVSKTFFATRVFFRVEGEKYQLLRFKEYIEQFS